MQKVGRNDPCPCGSGHKYKKCCLQKSTIFRLDTVQIRRTEGEMTDALTDFVKAEYGVNVIQEAWREFTLWPDSPMKMAGGEVSTIFLMWFHYNWIPGNTDRAGSKQPKMSIALQYLERYRYKLTSLKQCFIEAMCAQHYSYFIVTETEPGVSMTLSNIMLQQNVTVLERQASETLKKGNIIYTRVITLDVSVMVGAAPMVIPNSRFNALIDMRSRLSGGHSIVPDFLVEHERALRRVYLDAKVVFENTAVPQVTNSDGERLTLVRLHYDLQCTAIDAFHALKSLAMTKDGSEFLDDADYDPEGNLVKVEFPWLKQRQKQRSQWKNTVLGRFTITGKKLVVDVNSQARTDIIKRKITKRLKQKATFKHIVLESVEDLMAESEGSKGHPPLNQPQGLVQSAETQAAIADFLKKHWGD